MSCLNEQLAVEVMGMEWKQVYWYKDGEVAYYHHNAVDCAQPGLEHWDPINNKNQLWKCYEALSEEEKQAMWRVENPVDYAIDLLNAKGLS